MNRRERRAAAKGFQSVSRDASSVAALYKAALRHIEAERFLDAQICCRQALERDALHADTLHLMGVLSFRQGHNDLAVEWFANAIRQNPKAEYLSNLGAALQRLGRHDEALKALDKAVQLKPDDAALWTNLGVALEELTRLSDAELCFQRALQLDPRHFEAAFRNAVLLHRLGRLEEAIVQLDLCDELRPHHFAMLWWRSIVLRGLKRFEEYLADSRRAHALDQNNAEVCNNIGDALLLLHRFDDAMEWFDRALEIRPSFILALANRSVALGRTHRFDEAIATYQRIRSIDPTNATAEFHLANLDLLLGNFETGWRGREARWRVSGLPISFPDGPEPVWLGEEGIEGKTILIYSDEGLGDAIQFTRYVPMLAARGAQIVLVVQQSQLSLLSTLPGLTRCLPSSVATLPPVDFRCPLTSLPLAFRTTLDSIPPPSRLSPSADRITAWEQRLGHHDRLRVGLAWSGSLTHPNDHSRSISLRLLTRILDLDATFVSLQRDPRPDDRTVLLERTGIVDLTAHLTDFTETAALVSCLDLVITVDTSIAHLAGTMGCPTWIMIAHTPDYRWLLNRDDSPWYPSVRLFRQTKAGDYAEVLERIQTELASVISNRPANVRVE